MDIKGFGKRCPRDRNNCLVRGSRKCLKVFHGKALPCTKAENWEVRDLINIQITLAAASKGEESREAPEKLAWGMAFPEATRMRP